MKITTRPGFVLNRGGKQYIADEKGFLELTDKEAISVLEKLFPVTKEVGKSEKKK